MVAELDGMNWNQIEVVKSRNWCLWIFIDYILTNCRDISSYPSYDSEDTANVLIQLEMNAYISNYDDEPKEVTGKILSMQIPLFYLFSINAEDMDIR